MFKTKLLLKYNLKRDTNSKVIVEPTRTFIFEDQRYMNSANFASLYNGSLNKEQKITLSAKLKKRVARFT